MATVTFDTHKFVKRLEAAGASSALAEALVEVQKESISDSFGTSVATKKDIEVATSKLEIKMSGLESDIKILKWMVGLIIGGIASLLGFAVKLAS